MRIFPFFSSNPTAAPSAPPAAAAAYNEPYNLEYPSTTMFHAAARNGHDQPATINIFSPSYWLQFDQQQPESVNVVQGYNSQFGMHDDNYQYADQLRPMNSDQLQQPNDEESAPNSGAYTKKAVHNAMERDRRNKLKVLYSELRLLLPNPNTKRKLSIPNTVCRVLRYIPELRNEIEELCGQRDELLDATRRISKSPAVTSKSCTRAADHHELMNDFTHCPPADLPINVSINSALGSSELIITIYARRAEFLFSTLLLVLEKEGLDVLSASTFLSQQQVCHNLHLLMIGRSEVDEDLLRKKLVVKLERSRKRRSHRPEKPGLL